MIPRLQSHKCYLVFPPMTHLFEYQIKDEFFLPYGAQDFKNCVATVKLNLEKNNGFMLLQFDVDGQLESSCDRCGDDLPVQLWDEFKLIVKLVDEPDTLNEQEEDPDVIYISRSESHLHVSDWIFEFINLSIPLQKRCKDLPNGTTGCNPSVLEKLAQMNRDATTDTHATVWKGLDQFKNFVFCVIISDVVFSKIFKLVETLPYRSMCICGCVPIHLR